MRSPSSTSLALLAASVLGCAQDGTINFPDDLPVIDDADDASADVSFDGPSFDVPSPDVPTPDVSAPDVVIDRADVSPDLASDAPTDTRVDAITDVVSDVRVDALADAALPDVASVDVAPDIASDVAPDVAPDVAADRVVDVTTDVPLTPWTGSATEHDCAAPGVLGARFDYLCAPGSASGPVWGSGVYTHDSFICAAAVHAGRITAAGGGVVTIEMRPGQSAYASSTHNGITSNAYGTWSCSYAVVAPACVTPGATTCDGLCADLNTDALNCGRCGNACGGTTACSSGVCGCGAGMMSCSGACVDTTSSTTHCGGCGRACATGETCVSGVCGAMTTPWTTNATDHDCATPGIVGARFTYRCAPGGTPGTIWGTDVYTHDSSICTAAVHAGRITVSSGGAVTIQMAAGQSSYASSTRNGITSNAYGAWSCSYTFP